ncbi:hypothetical protein CNR22_06095 [Sphingobacteriaceae bacterium]|nr:hypothetical protein CNR22_06095 [Sphingobacteriaceae bacterium]
MEKAHNFIIDFDSTFVKVEAFDELCKLCYTNENERSVILDQVKAITDKGMRGELSINESLESRLLLLNAHKKHLKPLIEILRGMVSASFSANKEFLKLNADKVFIVSNGFCEFILPVVLEYGIKAENVFANSFIFDEYENIIGFDHSNLLASPQGKVKLVSQLNLSGEIIVIGDGYTDYEVREAGIASVFYAFVENVRRDNVVSKADHVAATFDQIISDYEKKLNQVNQITNLLKKSA